MSPFFFLFYEFIVYPFPRSAPRRSATVTEHARFTGRAPLLIRTIFGYQWCSRAPRATLYMCLLKTRYCTRIFEPKPDHGNGRTVVHPVDRQWSRLSGVPLSLDFGGLMLWDHNNSLNLSTDIFVCLSIWDRVERLIGRWAGTMIFIVSLGSRFCKRIWLPLCLTTIHPSRRRALMTLG